MHRFEFKSHKRDLKEEFRQLIKEFATDSVEKLTEALTVARHYESTEMPSDEEQEAICAKGREEALKIAEVALGGKLKADETYPRKFAVMTEMVFERCLEIIREAKNERN